MKMQVEGKNCQSLSSEGFELKSRPYFFTPGWVLKAKKRIQINQEMEIEQTQMGQRLRKLESVWLGLVSKNYETWSRSKAF